MFPLLSNAKSQPHNNILAKLLECCLIRQDVQINDSGQKHQFVMIVKICLSKLPQNLIAAIEISGHNSNHAHFIFIGDGPTLNDCQQQVVQAG